MPCVSRRSWRHAASCHLTSAHDQEGELWGRTHQVSVTLVSPQGHAYSRGDQGGEGSFNYDTQDFSTSTLTLFCGNASLQCLGMFDWTLVSSLACPLHCLHCCMSEECHCVRSKGVACWEARSMAAVLFLKSRKLSSGGRSNPFGFNCMISQQFFLLSKCLKNVVKRLMKYTSI
jgi:hypothetical protein